MTWKADLARGLNRVLNRFDMELIRSSDFWHPMKQLGQQPPVGDLSPVSPPVLKSFYGANYGSPQQPADFAVMIISVLRPTLVDTLRSVFEQRFDGRVQILIGIDAQQGDLSLVEDACRTLPDRYSVLLIYPGYSTSRRHGGLDYSWIGGSLRIVLSHLANSRYITTLDDDNWWSDDHLESMHAALSTGADWAWSLRWYVHPISRRPICHDDWESIGPGKGHYAEWGGWVDPNCLAINKIACEAAIRWWSIPPRNSPTALDSDRTLFRILSTRYQGIPTNRYSVFYQIAETDRFMHPFRLSKIGADRYSSFAKPEAT